MSIELAPTISSAPVRRWKRYPAYRDSGVEWIGEVPEGWELLKTKQLARRIQTGSTPPTSELHYYENGSVPWFGPGSFGKDLVLDEPVKFISKTALEDGVARIFKGQSTMIVTIGATIGKVGYIESSASSNQQITAVTFNKTRTIPKYAAYQIKRLEPVLRGIAPNTTLPILNQDDIGHLPFCLPSIPEQRAIATFLDSETGRIDALIEKKERQIELLQEKRAALISHAVTKGLDPDVKMKDSGVEWIGKMLDEWSSTAVKHHFDIQLGKMLQNKPDSDELLVPYAKALHVLWGKVETNVLPEMWANTFEIQQYGIKKGDLLVCEGGEVGRAGIVESPPKQCIIQNALHRVRAKNSSDLRYLLYVLHAVNSSTWFNVLCNKATIAHFTREKFSDLIIPIPPLPEQRAIAAFLDRETEHIDTLTIKVRESTSKLREYRTALISAAVTGKIDVRNKET